MVLPTGPDTWLWQEGPIIPPLWPSYPYSTHNSHSGMSHFLIMQIFRSKAMNASD